MANLDAGLQAHLDTGATTLCHAWAITRSDGLSFGFTDHDLPLEFDGIDFAADTGLSAAALAQSTGLSVDNSEAIGALSDAGLSEADIEAGRFDGAEISAWLVNWADPSQRQLQFRGSIGEIRRANGAFTAELRGLTDALNRPLGRAYQKPCFAVLGDGRCQHLLTEPAFVTTKEVETVSEARVLTFSDLSGYDAAWFTRGRLDVVSGNAAGLWGAIKEDRDNDGVRVITLWEPLRAPLAAGDQVKLTAGCDKRFETCRDKFNNLINFQGFPDLPSDEWIAAIPRSTGANTGGSLR